MPKQETIDQQVEALESRATELHRIIELAPRAFVVEFAGTPKSGKSTSVEAIRHFFKRYHFSVHVLTERAAQCPIPMKGHLFFNTWCAASMLAELLENIANLKSRMEMEEVDLEPWSRAILSEYGESLG